MPGENIEKNRAVPRSPSLYESPAIYRPRLKDWMWRIYMRFTCRGIILSNAYDLFLHRWSADGRPIMYACIYVFAL